MGDTREPPERKPDESRPRLEGTRGCGSRRGRPGAAPPASSSPERGPPQGSCCLRRGNSIHSRPSSPLPCPGALELRGPGRGDASWRGRPLRWAPAAAVGRKAPVSCRLRSQPPRLAGNERRKPRPQRPPFPGRATSGSRPPYRPHPGRWVSWKPYYVLAE